MNTDQIEHELQFEAANLDAVDAWLRAQPSYATVSVAPQQERLQQDTYFDTTDWAIYRAGYSLRSRRFSGGAAELTLKALSTSDTQARMRREINQPVSLENGDWLAAEGNVSTMVRLIAGTGRPQPLFDVETNRRSYRLLRNGETLATLSLDDTSIRRNDLTQQTLRRVEVEEERVGGLADLEVFVDGLVRACDLRPADASKFESALDATDMHPDAYLNLGYTELAADALAGDFAFALLRRYFATFLKNEPGTRLDEDPEALHDMRVAARRLRAAMSTFRGVLPMRFASFREEMRWVGQKLGDVRDLDVQMEWLNGVREGSDWHDATALGPLLQELVSRRTKARSELLDALNSERYAALVSSMVAVLREGEGMQPLASQPIGQLGRKLLKKRYRRFRKDAAALTDESEPAQFHVVRIVGKKLRYALEGLEAVNGPRGARMTAAMRKVQDTLGEMQDCNVAIAWLREMATAHGAGWPPDTVFRMGELVEQRRGRIATLRQEWPGVRREVKSGWKALRRTMKKPRPEAAAESKKSPPADEPVPVQRPFAIFQRFLRRRKD